MYPYSRSYCPAVLADCEDHSNKGFRNREALWRIGADAAINQTWAEFGVGAGTSARGLAKLLGDGVFYLFDSWEGIPDPWDLGGDLVEPIGKWRFSRLREFDDRVEMVDGLYSDVLPFIFPGQLGLIHIDCDVYRSTRDVLTGCDGFIASGTVLIFDELIGYEKYADHEYRAVTEWMEETGKRIVWLGKESFGAVGIVCD